MEKSAMPSDGQVGIRLVLAGLGLIFCLWALANPSAQAREPVRIFAAASTIGAVNQATAIFIKQSKVKVVAVFASSGALARQLAAGAPGHLFLSANRKWMAWAQSQGAIAGETRRVLLRNRLVVVIHKGRELKIADFEKIDFVAMVGAGRLAIADPAHAPLGIHARAALRAMGVWKQLGPRALRLADAARARVLVERGEAAFGILYESDVVSSPRLEAAGIFPASFHPPITYEIALTRAGKGDKRARKLLHWLAGPQAARVFAKHGFRVD
jgi:molybdate transport system substrate-binding protein